MRTRIVRSALIGALLVAVALGSVGCGTPSVPKDQVAKQLSDALTAQAGTAPQSVTCADNLPGTVGAMVTCTVVGAARTTEFTATVASVEGGTVKLQFAPVG